jgi:hypothetical protein
VDLINIKEPVLRLRSMDRTLCVKRLRYLRKRNVTRAWCLIKRQRSEYSVSCSIPAERFLRVQRYLADLTPTVQRGLMALSVKTNQPRFNAAIYPSPSSFLIPKYIS